MGVETAVALGVIAAGTAYTANRQHEAQNTAERAARRQVTQAQLLKDQQAKPVDPALIAQQKARRAALGGQQSTILTGPSGIGDSGGKSLLGS